MSAALKNPIVALQLRRWELKALAELKTQGTVTRGTLQGLINSEEVNLRIMRLHLIRTPLVGVET